MNYTTPPGTASKRDGAIDALRVGLLVYVIAYLHLGAYIGDGEQHVAWWTPALTTVVLGAFTFLSGFVLGDWRGGRGAQAVWSFYKRRLLRIYPLYILALLGFVALWLTPPALAIRAAFGLSMFWPEPPMTLWYVTMILVCYLLAPLLVMPGLREGLTWAAALWSAMLALHVLVHPIDLRIATHFPAFVLGVVCRRASWRDSLTSRRVSLAAWSVPAFVAAASCLSRPELAAFAAIPSVLIGSLALMAWADHLLGGRTAGPVLAFLSYIGFAAYLFHRIVFQLIFRFAWPATERAQWVVLLAVGLPLVVMLSTVLQRGSDRLLGGSARTTLRKPEPG